MSAFIMNDESIGMLTKAAQLFEAHLYDPRLPKIARKMHANFTLDPKNTAYIFKTLYKQNERSVNARYHESDVRDENWAEIAQKYAPHYLPWQKPAMPDPVIVLKLCDCYDYQACETDDYNRTIAKRLIDAIRKAAIYHLPGYEKAPWGL